jgi:hypothetical protein
LSNHQQWLARFGHHLAPANFRAFDKSMERAQRSHLVVPRVDSLDALDRGLERERQASDLHWRIASASFSLKPDACELVNGIPQLRRIVVDGFNDARKNNRKVYLRQPRRKVLSAA